MVVPTEMLVEAVEDVAKDPGSVEKREKADMCTWALRNSINGIVGNIPGCGAAATGAGAVQAAHLNVMNAATISDEVESQIRVTRAELLTSALDLLAVVLGADEAEADVRRAQVSDGDGASRLAIVRRRRDGERQTAMHGRVRQGSRRGCR